MNTHVVGAIESEGLLISCSTQQSADLEEEPERNHVAQHPDCTERQSSALIPIRLGYLHTQQGPSLSFHDSLGQRIPSPH